MSGSDDLPEYARLSVVMPAKARLHGGAPTGMQVVERRLETSRRGGGAASAMSRRSSRAAAKCGKALLRARAETDVFRLFAAGGSKARGSNPALACHPHERLDIQKPE